MEKKIYMMPDVMVFDIKTESIMEVSIGGGSGAPGDIGQVNRRWLNIEKDEEEEN